MIYPTRLYLFFLLLSLIAVMVLLPLEVLLKSSTVLNLPGITPIDLSFMKAGISPAIQAVLAFDTVATLLLILDGLLLPSRKRFSLKRITDATYSVNFAHRVTLDVDIKPGLLNRLRVRLFDDAGEDMTVEGFPNEGKLETGRNRIEYRLRVHRRGDHRLKCVYITVYSLLGFTKKVFQIPGETRLRVFSDLKSVSRYILLARKSHLGLLGIRKTSRAGGDNEFERLRDYQTDDEIRHIDWKATARNDRLIVRTYQMSQNQSIIFMLDCGRMMTAMDGGRTMLDYALDSVLLLARVALEQGDRVGFLAFDSKILRYVKPAAHVSHHQTLVRAAYDLEARYEETNFDIAFQYLNTVSRKRSLVCLVTNIIDQMNAEIAQSYLGSLSGKHLPFAVLLKYPGIHNLLEEPPVDEDELYAQAAAADFLLWKSEVMRKLRNMGVLTLETLPEHLDADLINQYLRIKAQKLL